MPTATQDLLAVIDIGSAKTTVLVGDPTPDGGICYVGHGIAETKGVKRGVVADLKQASDSVKRAVDAAEKMIETNIGSAFISVGGAHIRGVNSEAVIQLSTRQREISRDDVRAVVERARQIQMPADRTVIHLLPRHFTIDSQIHVQDPLGMAASRLAVSLHVITCSASAHQSMIRAVQDASVEVLDTVFDGVAAAETLSGFGESERILGGCVIDIGAGSTDVVVYHEGAVFTSFSIGIGGEHFTSDAAIGLRCALPDAERMKCIHGAAVVTRVPSENDIEVPAGASPRIVSQRFLAEIIEPRARELFELIREQLRAGGALELLGSGAYITGGVARLMYLDEICESVLRCPVHLEAATPLPRLPGELIIPEMATVTGLLAYAHRTRAAKRVEEQGLRGRIRQLFAGA